MKLRIMALFLGFCLAFGSQMAHNSHANEFSAAELKKMGIFLSNFTELGFRTFTAKEILNEDKPYDMIYFGVMHNYVNNFKSRIKSNKSGMLTISTKYVRESLKKYFGYTLNKYGSVKGTDGMDFILNGPLYEFQGADGEAVYYARVQKASTIGGNVIKMQGYLYNVDDEDDRNGLFTALALPHKYNGKNTWRIVSMEVEQWYVILVEYFISILTNIQ